ncbi:hypothetical protein B0T11DRAFT_327997 [Plectosphaerella cucumerina]|uniref:Sur7 protein n=1 Tax=Plectosphaerella cucumerina TaxID=40658 RepID=A0A8K0X359_9PEZI|nr:hypothetical protein B0T11DRAFT_327997 [Plectosphaerella cucumerina]
MISRLLAIIPALLATVTVALSIVLLVAGSGPSTAPGFFWLSFNTTNLGGDLIEITRDGSSNGGDSGNGGNTGLPLPGGGTLPTPGGAIGDLFGGLRGSLDSLLDDMVNAINSGVGDLQSSILGNLTDALGVKDNYRLYLSEICEGSLSDPNNPSSQIRMQKCVPYSETKEGLRNITNSIPSSLSVGGTTVSVPLVEALTQTLDSLLSLATHGSRALLALRIISVISNGTVMLASFAIIILGNRRFLIRTNLVSSLIGGTTTLLFAAVMTGLIVAGRSALESLGGSVGLQVTQGNAFLAVGWIIAGFASGAALYWFTVWFVEFRLSSFKRRSRTGDEIGNWRGILSEVKSDLRLSHKA